MSTSKVPSKEKEKKHGSSDPTKLKKKPKKPEPEPEVVEVADEDEEVGVTEESQPMESSEPLLVEAEDEEDGEPDRMEPVVEEPPPVRTVVAPRHRAVVPAGPAIPLYGVESAESSWADTSMEEQKVEGDTKAQTGLTTYRLLTTRLLYDRFVEVFEARFAHRKLPLPGFSASHVKEQVHQQKVNPQEKYGYVHACAPLFHHLNRIFEELDVHIVCQDVKLIRDNFPAFTRLITLVEDSTFKKEFPEIRDVVFSFISPFVLVRADTVHKLTPSARLGTSSGIRAASVPTNGKKPIKVPTLSHVSSNGGRSSYSMGVRPAAPGFSLRN